MLFHTDELIVQERSAVDYVGSPMYRIIEQHTLAAILSVLVIVGLLIVRRSAFFVRFFPGRLTSFRTESTAVVVVSGSLFVSAALHFGLAFGHEPTARTPLYLVGAVLLGVAGLATVRQTPSWKRISIAALLGSLIGYPVVLLTGEAPDQLGTMTKMLEFFALMLLVGTYPLGRRRRLATAGGMFLMFFIAVSSWVGAFVGTDHHGGGNPPPGFLIPIAASGEVTPAQEEATRHLYEETVAALTRYEDPAVAAADGYDVEGIAGTDFHADNPSLKNDGYILEPSKPETLVYAMGDDGPVLLGAMFQTDSMGQPGPTVGGDLTPWHAHGNICFTFVGLMGATDPFGQCPLGTLSIPHSNEMMHVWTIAGAPDPFGDLNEDWLIAELGLK